MSFSNGRTCANFLEELGHYLVYVDEQDLIVMNDHDTPVDPQDWYDEYEEGCVMRLATPWYFNAYLYVGWNDENTCSEDTDYEDEEDYEEEYEGQERASGVDDSRRNRRTMQVTMKQSEKTKRTVM